MATKNNPGEFDCYVKADPNEPMFILLGRDPCAPPLVRMWIAMRLDQGTITEEKADEAFACVDEMEAWAIRGGLRAQVDALADAKGAFRVVSWQAANGADMNRGRSKR